MSGATRSRQSAVYAAVPYRVGGALVRVGRRSREMDQLLDEGSTRTGVIVTAWNPAGRKLPLAVNQRRAERLAERLRGLRTLPGANGEGRWHEDSLLVLTAPPRRIEALARLLGQDAVVLVRRGARARLRFLR